MNSELSRNLRFALVHDWLAVHGGAEEVLREIASMYDGPVITSQFNPRRFLWLEEREVRISFVQYLPLSLARHFIYAPLMPFVYRRFDLSDFDVVLGDSHSFAHGVRRAPGALHINYFHTTARSLWLPEIDERAKGALRSLLVPMMKRLDLEAAKRPDVLFANSRTTADRVRKFYGREVERVIYPPVSLEKFLRIERAGDDEGYLMWGRLIPYKRFDLAIEAAKALGFKLNVAGAGPHERRLKELAAGVRGVTFHGRLSDEDLASLMSRSRAVIFPCYEDFGIVPVEAMAAGLPVVALGAGGASEVVLPECGVLFREQTAEALCAAVQEFERRSFDVNTLRSNAARFDREVFRTEYRAGVEEAIERHFGKGGAS